MRWDDRLTVRPNSFGRWQLRFSSKPQRFFFFFLWDFIILFVKLSSRNFACVSSSTESRFFSSTRTLFVSRRPVFAFSFLAIFRLAQYADAPSRSPTDRKNNVKVLHNSGALLFSRFYLAELVFDGQLFLSRIKVQHRRHLCQQKQTATIKLNRASFKRLL